MQTLTLELPLMYGDHHVLEVRRVLSAMPGVESVYASSCFHTVEVTYDPVKANADTIRACLESAGYLGELVVPVEFNVGPGSGFFRHTSAFEQTKNTIGFAQNVAWSGRPLWPCPGMGAIKTGNGEE